MNPEIPIHTYPINIGVNERAFAGLAHQNMTCIQALCELVDNAIAAYPEQQQGLVAIILSRLTPMPSPLPSPTGVSEWVLTN